MGEFGRRLPRSAFLPNSVVVELHPEPSPDGVEKKLHGNDEGEPVEV